MTSRSRRSNLRGPAQAVGDGAVSLTIRPVVSHHHARYDRSERVLPVQTRQSRIPIVIQPRKSGLFVPAPEHPALTQDALTFSACTPSQTSLLAKALP